MTSKTEIFNLTLGLLLLSKTVSNPDTDTGSEVRVLNTHFSTSLETSLAEMDLDRTAVFATLSLLQINPSTLWNFAYKYPSKCVLFRRIRTCLRMDDRSTRIPYEISQLVIDGKYETVIFTNQESAVGEFQSTEVPLAALNSHAKMANAYKLAMMSAPLVTGKGARSLMESLQSGYINAKAEAQKHDKLENFNFEHDIITSEFVRARMS